MENEREIELLRKTRHDLKEYYRLLRMLRKDLEKMITNFRLTSDICKTQKDPLNANPVNKNISNKVN